MADFRELLNQAEAELKSEVEVLHADQKKAKEAELSFIEKKDELKDREAKVKAKEKEVDAKIKKLEKLELIEADQQKQIEREQAIEQRERLAKKMLDDAATTKLQAEQALEGAKKVVEKANKEKAEIEAQILKRFKEMVIGG